MNNDLILVTGSIIARPETLNELLRVSLEHVRRSRTEPGCIAHNVQTDCENPLRLVFAETWASEAALLAHFAVSESREFAALAGKLAAEPTQIGIYEARPSGLMARMAR